MESWLIHLADVYQTPFGRASIPIIHNNGGRGNVGEQGEERWERFGKLGADFACEFVDPFLNSRDFISPFCPLGE